MNEVQTESSKLNTIIGKNIRNERLKRRISIEQLAEFLDISPAFMGLIERGQRGIRIGRLLDISRIFNVNIDSLVQITSDDGIDTYSEIEIINCLLKQLSANELTFVHESISSLIKNLKTRS